jgi:hypothetical protein
MHQLVNLLRLLQESVNMGIKEASLKAEKASQEAESARFVAFMSLIISAILGLIVILK